MAAGEKAQAEGAAPGLTIREAQRACEAAGVPFKHKKVCSTCNLYFPRTWYCAGCAWHGRDEAEWYCSTTCQKAHWRAGHKDSCRRLRISADEHEWDMEVHLEDEETGTHAEAAEAA